MKEIILILCLFFSSFSLCHAQLDKPLIEPTTYDPPRTEVESDNIPISGYIIEDFQSRININQDTSLTITEVIKTNFFVEKHGIFRIIPVIYSYNRKTIRARFNLISVTDENDQPYITDVNPFGQSIKIKIGNPNLTISGPHTYIIKYKIGKVLIKYKDHEEIYWNITGNEWDTEIIKSSVVLDSNFAQITKIDCFAGYFGSKEKYCKGNFYNNEAIFYSTSSLGDNKDFTIVVSLDNKNNLIFPSKIMELINLILDNWGYIAAIFPLFLLLLFWYIRGRDQQYINGNIYYKPDDKTTSSVSLFAREHLPLVYSPIDGLTPSQVGTIIDQKVNIQDVVAEIVELARLKYLEILKFEKKGLLKTDTNFIFVKNNKDINKLTPYQQFLLEKLFSIKADKQDLEKILKNNLSPEIKKIVEKGIKDPLVIITQLSDLSEKFYKHLEEFKKKLYKNLSDEKIFDGEPDKVKTKWTCLSIILVFISFIFVIIFSALTLNPGPILFNILIIIPLIIIARSMPKRTAFGHSLFRQAVGLRYYINEGKWREEIAEKNLFFEEILPLAIALGVVDKLTKDMASLGVKPPSYFSGSNIYAFNSDFSQFSNKSKSNLLSAPYSNGRSSWSGHSSWSGGSGFSGGGSSGGGFGGGGGGSW